MHRQQIPDLLSILRLLLSAPLFGVLCVSDGSDIEAVVSACLLISMLATDRLDGSLARRWGCASKNGTSLDISADIVMALSSSLALCLNGTVSYLVVAVMAMFAIQFPLTSEMLVSSRNATYDRLGMLTGMSCMVFPLTVIIAVNVHVEGLTDCLQAAIVILCIAGTANRLRTCLKKDTYRQVCSERRN